MNRGVPIGAPFFCPVRADFFILLIPKYNIMAQVNLGGNPVNTTGELPQAGQQAPDFNLTAADLSQSGLADYAGKKIVLNIFPSVDTPTCAASVRKFNETAASLENTVVLCISRDLPFAQQRFCASEGLTNVHCLSDFKTGAFGRDYGVMLSDGKLEGLHARAVVVVDENGSVSHRELVPEIANEPDYDAALAAL